MFQKKKTNGHRPINNDDRRATHSQPYHLTTRPKRTNPWSVSICLSVLSAFTGHGILQAPQHAIDPFPFLCTYICTYKHGLIICTRCSTLLSEKSQLPLRNRVVYEDQGGFPISYKPPLASMRTNKSRNREIWAIGRAIYIAGLLGQTDVKTVVSNTAVGGLRSKRQGNKR